MTTSTTSAQTGRTGKPAAEKDAPTGHLELRDVVKVFSNRGKDVYAVHGVSLDVAPGEFITFLGPSGCGKTTTLRMIAGFENATAGQVILDGQNMVSLPPNRRPMSMVFQSYALFPHLSVRDNVGYGLKLRRVPEAEMREQVDVALTSMNLTSLADRAPNELSGGQQQRVALARAMVVQPRCCCSTSRCPTWTRSCACACAWRSGACSGAWASLRSTSPTTSPRR
ncbi:ABC transporter ATP-binding protein [Actinomyces ruminis]|uniref:ABC transporter ATP-binding protein n=1 Tax=Actinomyces ruminis TaxID=1937003 RepID=UPI00211E35D7|nr:ABC transporter ATP-binding protein [Actinomyces ruminis]